MSRRILFCMAMFLAAKSLWCAERYPVNGLLLKVDAAHKTFVASCGEIPGYMKAMVMSYQVRDEKDLDGLKPGLYIDFTLVVEKDDAWAESVRIHHYIGAEQEPMRARRLQLLEELQDKNPEMHGIALGEPVPGFTLTDQAGQRVSLRQFAGKVVAMTFIYTSCPLPNYCYRMSNNFGRLKTRFAARMGRDLVLLSVTFDPAHDTPGVLSRYAANWKADPASWHFLTGPLEEIRQLCRAFGLNYWPDEGLITHSLRTVVIDRQGRLAANLEGNEYSAEQLGDFVEATLNRSR